MFRSLLIVLIVLSLITAFLGRKEIKNVITDKINKKIVVENNIDNDLDDTPTIDVYEDIDNSSRYEKLRY